MPIHPKSPYSAPRYIAAQINAHSHNFFFFGRGWGWGSQIDGELHILLSFWYSVPTIKCISLQTHPPPLPCSPSSQTTWIIQTSKYWAHLGYHEDFFHILEIPTKKSKKFDILQLDRILPHFFTNSNHSGFKLFIWNSISSHKFPNFTFSATKFPNQFRHFIHFHVIKSKITMAILLLSRLTNKPKSFAWHYVYTLEMSNCQHHPSFNSLNWTVQCKNSNKLTTVNIKMHPKLQFLTFLTVLQANK